jgi:hypothetical protein
MALPNETLSAIFHELSPSSLATVARLSARFNGVAERILYSSVYITDILSESSPLPYRTLWWCEAMRRRAHLFESARKLHIRWQVDASSCPPSPYLANACEQLAGVVRLLVPLESLDLFLGPANLVPGHHRPPLHAVERVIRDCRFSQLRACALGAEGAKGAQPYTGTLLAFLASLTHLRHLRLSDVHSALDLPPGALPHLSSFRGSADAAASLLPGRPVHYLALVGEDSDVNRDNLPRMTCTTVPLRYLDLSAMSVRPLLLRNVSTYLPTVESLRVKLALRHTLHYAFSGIVSLFSGSPPSFAWRLSKFGLLFFSPPLIPRSLADGHRRCGKGGFARRTRAVSGMASRVSVPPPHHLPFANRVGSWHGQRLAPYPELRNKVRPCVLVTKRLFH